MEPPQISVVGAGYWGKKVIREILNLSKTTGKVKLCSIVDNSPSILEQCAKEFGPLTYHLNYRDLLSDPYVSAVHICSPNASHFEVASEFLRSKKDVLVEKPLALRTREAYELVRLGEMTGRVLSAGHIHRFNNGVKELKRIVGNEVLDLWPSKISCRGRGYRSRSSDEVAFITAEYLNGIVANIELSWLDYEKRRDVTIVGSDAVARLDCLDQKLTLQRSDRTESVSVVSSNTLGEEILHFADCIERNKRSAAYTNVANGTIGANVVRLLEASKKSLYEERSVQVQSQESTEIPAGEPTHKGFWKLSN